MKKYMICFFTFIIIFMLIKNNLNKNTYALTDLFEMNQSKIIEHELEKTYSDKDDDKEEEYKKEIKDILCLLMEERTKIMQDVIYGRVSLEEGQELLSCILENPLLKTDIDYINQVLEYPTDVEEVLKMEIGPIENLTKKDTLISFNSEVIWTLRDNEKITETKIPYNFELSIDNKDYKLVNYLVDTN